MNKYKISILIALLISLSSIGLSASALETTFTFAPVLNDILKTVEKDIEKAASILSMDKEGFNLERNFNGGKQKVAAAVEYLAIDARAVLSADSQKARLADIITSDDSEWHVFTEQDGKWTMHMIYSKYNRSNYEYVGVSGTGKNFKDAVIRAEKFMADGELQAKKSPVLVDTHTMLFLVFEVNGEEYATYGDYMDDPSQFTKMWMEFYGYNPYDVVPLSTFIQGLKIMYAS